MRMYGLIGYPLSHSFSKSYFAEKFLHDGIVDCRYDNYPLPSIEHFRQLVESTPLSGLNITIPYKQQVIPYLHEMNEVVGAIGACNCIKFRNGKLHGYNTDTIGFERSLLKNLLPHHTNALILGTGGASQAIMYVLKKLKINYTIVSRGKANTPEQTISYGELTDSLIGSHPLIINTTPLGMYPEIETFPPINFNMLTPEHYLFDLVYNPEMTLFLKKGKEKGAVVQNGYEMLIIQAEESWNIWNNNEV